MTNRPIPSKEKASCENASIMVMVELRKRLVGASTVTKARRRARGRLKRVNDNALKSVSGCSPMRMMVDEGVAVACSTHHGSAGYQGGKCGLDLIRRETAAAYYFNQRRTPRSWSAYELAAVDGRNLSHSV